MTGGGAGFFGCGWALLGCAPVFWIPAFAGMTGGGGVGMTGVGGSLRGWLRSCVLDSRVRGNDGCGVGTGMTGVGGSLRGWLRSCVLDSRVRGLGAGMTGVGGSLRGWLRSCVLDSRVRGNDGGGGGGNDGVWVGRYGGGCAPVFWIPAFAGMTGWAAGMTGVGGSLRGWLRSCVLDSRVRGNDGVGGGNDGCGWVVTGVVALLCFGFPRSRE